MIPRRLRVLFSEPTETPDFDAPAIDDEPTKEPTLEEVAFVAYGEDCLLSGRTVLDADRLSDMLNGHDEYALIGVTVQRLDDGTPLQVEEVIVPRDELVLVHASGPRGDANRRHRTMLQHVALKMGPYKVRGFLHALFHAFRQMTGGVYEGEGAEVCANQGARSASLWRNWRELFALEHVEERAFAGIGLSDNDDGVFQPFQHFTLGMFQVHGVHETAHR